jgi:starvation-inducible DNA-binding protein
VEEMRKGYYMSLKEKQQSKLNIAILPLNLFNDSNHSQKVIEILNHALADEIVLSMKTRNAKWNMYGNGVIELCGIYEIQIRQINDFAEEIVSRIKMLHGHQIEGLSDYLAYSRITESPGIIPNVTQLLVDHESIIRFFREDYRNYAKYFADISTSEMFIKIIRQHEKMAWMLRSLIQLEITNDDSTAIIQKSN